jgi:cobalt-zinc-cadmium efflux system protein
MSIGVAIFIFISAIKSLKEILDIFLEKAPLDVKEIEKHILEIDGIIDVHHVHLRSLDGHNSYATMHVVTNEKAQEIKIKIREELREHGITHATLELELENENCGEKHCNINPAKHHTHHHTHHNHHH